MSERKVGAREDSDLSALSVFDLPRSQPEVDGANLPVSVSPEKLTQEDPILTEWFRNGNDQIPVHPQDREKIKSFGT